jgi:integrase/recombinase XerD
MSEKIQSFLEHLMVERGLAGNTISAYNTDLTRLESYLTTMRLEWDDVTPAVLVGYQQLGERDGLRRATLNRRLACFKGFFWWLKTTGAIAADPAAGLTRAREQRSIPEALTEAQARRLLDHPTIPVRERAILELLYGAALRVSELARVNVADFDPYQGTLRIRPEAGRERLVHLPEEAVNAVKVYLTQDRPYIRHLPSERAMFLNYTGRRMSRQCVWKTVKDAAHAAGFSGSIGPNTLRQSCAVNLLDKGVDVRTVQEMLGHSDLNTTLIYTRTRRRREQLAA